MFPNQVSYEPQRRIQRLPITRQDSHATRTSGFVSGSGPSKGKATGRDVVCSLPLEQWSIGVDIPPHEATPEPRANLIWDRGGLLKVQHVNSSTLFELHLEKGSLGTIQYVDVKVSKLPSGRICMLKSRRIFQMRCPSFRFARWRRPLYKARRVTDSS